MKRRGRMALLAGVSAIGVVLLAGCGGGTPTAGPSPLPSGVSGGAGRTTVPPGQTGRAPSTAPSASVDPDSDAAIVAAAHAYVAAFELSARRADTAPFFAVTTPDCNCRQGIYQLVEDLQSKHEVTDIALRISHVAIKARNKTNADVSFTIENASYDLINADGKVIDHGNPGHEDLVVSFVRSGSKWLAFLAR